MTRLRFAPSPTGKLHLGNIRAAMINYLYALQHEGEFVLRIDDTDHERSRLEYIEAIEADLAWLGIHYDTTFSQSSRFDRYAEVVEKLKEMGRLYPCYETPEELEFYRKQQLARRQPPIYNRKSLQLTDAQKQELKAQGRKPHWRFKLEEGEIKWHDMIRGDCQFNTQHLSDPVLIREDGVPLYTLPSVIDDLDYEITHIIRGEDHVTNTAVQMQIMDVLKPILGRSNHTITFGHFSLMTTTSGEGFSKRKGSLSISTLKEEGMLPVTIAAFLAKLGTSQAVEPYTSMQDVAGSFDINTFSRSAPKVAMEELWALNEKVIHKLTLDQAREHAPEALAKVDEAFWESIKPNLHTLNDVDLYYNICHGVIEPFIEEPAYIREAAEALADVSVWDETTWKTWAGLLKEKTGRKGKALFMPLRQAITGMSHGPEMGTFLPLINRQLVENRLKEIK